MLRRIAILALSAVLAGAPARAAALMNLRPGDAPPPFTLPDLAGKPVASSTLAGAPAAVLFWSTWSPRSAEMLDDFRRHAEVYGPKGLKILAVNIDGENLGEGQRAAIREYVAARALPFPVLLDEGLKTFAAWGIMAHPTEVVLDAAGRIAYVLPGYPLSLREELEMALRRAVGVEVQARREAPVSTGYVPQGMALQHFNLGRRLLAKGDTDKALAAFRRAAAADPAFLDAAIMAARISLAAGDLALAEDLARGVSPEMVNRGDLRYLLGGTMLAKGDIEAAELAFRDLREQLPREGWGEWGLGQAALARGERAAALGFFREARALQPENLEGEAFVRRHFRERWMRRETVAEEGGFIEVFPELGEMRERFRKLFGASGSTAAP